MKAIFLIVALFSCNTLTHAQFTGCINPNQRAGICVSVYECQSLLVLLNRRPLHPLDAQFIKASACNGGIGQSPHVCCTSDTGFMRNRRWPPTTSFVTNIEGYDGSSYINGWDLPYSISKAPSSTILFPNTGPWSSFSRKQGRGGDGSSGSNDSNGSGFEGGSSRAGATRTELLPTPPNCGGVTIETKIYGGDDARLNEFPWMVLFEYNRGAGGLSTNCGGSLINQRYVVTAAHCMKGKILREIGSPVAVRLGEHDTSQQTDCNAFTCAPEALRLGIEELIPHEQYKEASPNQEHDIGLVRLERNAHFSDSIRPICLPSVVAQSEAKPGQNYIVAGWGRTLNAAKSAVKQKLNVALVAPERCRNKFSQRKINIASTQLCAGGQHAKDSCDGDSGGPLMRFRDNAWVLEGVVSFGYKCGLRDWPGVYTNVIDYDKWIRNKIRV